MRGLGDAAGYVDGLAAALGALERDATMGVPTPFWQTPSWRADDGLVPAGGAEEGFAIAIGKNELQGLRGPVFLHTSSSHDYPLRL